MGTHNICLYKEIDKKYTGYNMKTAELLDCALIGVCVVIRLNTVCVYIASYTHTHIYTYSWFGYDLVVTQDKISIYTERKKKRRVDFIPKFHSSLKKFVK